MTYPKRLIEVDLPIKRISAHARREKSIRHGHISTLHIWWARRPLAACRAVICASLWPDPADANCPQSFRDAALKHLLAFAKATQSNAELSEICDPGSWQRYMRLAHGLDIEATSLKCQIKLRAYLLDFIADFAAWEASTNHWFLDTARSLTQAAHEAMGGEKGTRPLVVDPFAGGGAIPLEALRVGADAFASDLNPVAVLLNTVVLEYIPKYGQKLADEVRKWGQWVKEQAEQELTQFYPEQADGSTPIAYLWARTIKCEGPTCGAQVPLMRSLWLAKKASRACALKIVPNPKQKRVDFEIVNDAKPKDVREGTVRRGSATCPCCGYTTPVTSVRTQLKEQQGGARFARLTAIASTHPATQGRRYRLPSDADFAALGAAQQRYEKLLTETDGLASAVPDERFTGTEPRRIPLPLYGMAGFREMFSPRQMVTMVTLTRIVRRCRVEIIHRAGLPADLANAVATCIALNLGKIADLGNSLCRWEPNAECPRQLFARQAMAITWDFAESLPLGDSSGGWSMYIDRFVETLRATGSDWQATIPVRASAMHHPLPDDSANAIITDPPYYYSVPYSDLSDFFYIWLRRSLGDAFPDLLSGPLTPKEEECVQNLPHAEVKHLQKDRQFYEDAIRRSLGEARRIARPDAVGLVVFAHAATEAWEALLSGLIGAGWQVTASWPIDTEMGSRMIAQRQSSLLSSVHLTCRPRENSAGELRQEIGDWRDVLAELPKRIREWMKRLSEEGVVGADAIFACLGPALEIFSRYSHVEKASGERVLLKEYLTYVWGAVAQEALAQIFKDADATGFEEDARLTAVWLWTLNAGAIMAQRTEGGVDVAVPEAMVEVGSLDGVSQRMGRINRGVSDTDEMEDDTEEEDNGEPTGNTKGGTGYVLEFDAARKIAQGLGAHLEDLTSVIEVKGDKARLLSVGERTHRLFGKDEAEAPQQKRKKKDKQMKLFTLEEVESEEGGWGEKNVPKLGNTVLDRVHQSMILFAAGRGEAMRRFLVEDGAGQDQRFWKLANALSALYPQGTDEKRWVDGVLARKKGLGL